jgi:mannose-6-phosphate isomerase-like protein (cupin superfamily)
VTLTLARLTLAPHETSAQVARGPVLLSVEQGNLTLAEENSAEAEVRLEAGDGTVVPAGPAATLRNPGDGPLVVLIVAIAPATDDQPDQAR